MNDSGIKYSLMGVGGYVAPRHLKAIKETGGILVAAYDISDSVGILDSYFPDTSFFVEYERFDRHINKLMREGRVVDYLSICTPNHLHDSHIRFALRNKINVICEKPLVLNPWNAESLMDLEKETGKKINTILQLRLHPSIIKLKKEIDSNASKVYNFDLTYITARGNWYYTSWKGDLTKSGGVTTNIGIHLFDMLIWLFGPVKESIVHMNTHDRASGLLEFSRASVRWFLSINKDTLPEQIIRKGGQVFRSMTIDGEEIDFTEGFNNLHTESYQAILNGAGFGIKEAFPSIELAYQIRNQQPVGISKSNHPFTKKIESVHPFYTS